MAALDWIFLGVLGFSMLMGAWRGLVFELVSIIGWIAAFVLAQWLAPLAATHLPWSGMSESLRYVVGFVLVFVAALVLSALLAVLIKKLVAAVGLSPLDRLLGAVFGLARGLVLLLACAIVVNMTPLHRYAWWQDSLGAQWAQIGLQGLKPVLPQEFGKYLP